MRPTAGADTPGSARACVADISTKSRTLKVVRLTKGVIPTPLTKTLVISRHRHTDTAGAAAAPSVMVGPVAVTDLASQHLAVGTDRQIIDKLHGLRLLVPGKAFPAVVDQLAFGSLRARFADDDGVHRFAPVLVRDSDHDDVGHRGMGDEDLFHLARIDVVSARDDHVLGAIEQKKVAVRVEHPYVAGVEPAAANGGGGRPGGVALGAHHDVSAGHDLAGFARCERNSVRIDDPYFDIGARQAGRTEPWVVGSGEARVHL